MSKDLPNEWVITFRDFSSVYIVRNLGLRVELATVFDARETAMEIGRHVSRGHPFFDCIPLVAVGTVVPRPKDVTIYRLDKDGNVEKV